MSSNGQFAVGDKVILGEHQTIDVHGRRCNQNWASPMDAFVGKEATIISSAVDDGSGSPLYRVDIDQGKWAWRGVNMTLVSSTTTRTTSATKAAGATCSKCREFNEYVEANPHFTCYRCAH